MINKKILNNRTDIFLKKITLKNCTKEYVMWLNDPTINNFLESRWQKVNLKKLKKFVIDINQSKNEFMTGIFLKKTNVHIGNIKLGKIDSIHKTAELGLLIGKKQFFNKGYASEAIKLITNFAFKKMGLKYIYANVYIDNVASQKVILKNNFKKSGIFKKKAIFKKKRTDIIYFEKLI